ncbi:hypothetical protein Pfo_018404, partial [Paulownia fortunei]
MAAALIIIRINIHLCSYPSMENQSNPPGFLAFCSFLFSLSRFHTPFSWVGAKFSEI